jgi:3-oxoadipate enol-lactonase
MRRAITQNSVSLEYEVSGSGEPVLFIHGALIARPFRVLISNPQLRGYRLLEYHRRGYGGSSPTSGTLSVREQASDCLDLLRELGVTRAHVAGHSFGGAVALQMALDAPQAVHTLALLEPALMVGETGASYRQSLEQGIARFRDTDTAALLDGFMEARWPGYRQPLAEALPGAFEQAIVDAGTTFESELPGLLEWDFGEAEAARISQPCLSVLGAASEQLWPRFGKVHRWLLAHVSGAEGAIIPEAHHMMMVENPQALARVLSAFFKANPIRA